MEDYKAKYEEALDKARKLDEDGCHVLRDVFPELNESEDERIICNIKKAAELYWSDEPLNEILSWLEKQKEPRDYRKLYEEIVKSDWFKENYVGKSLGEGHQPAEWSEEDEKRYISCLGRLQTEDGSPTINSSWFEDHCYPQKHWKPSEEQMNEKD